MNHQTTEAKVCLIRGVFRNGKVIEKLNLIEQIIFSVNVSLNITSRVFIKLIK